MLDQIAQFIVHAAAIALGALACIALVVGAVIAIIMKVNNAGLTAAPELLAQVQQATRDANGQLAAQLEQLRAQLAASNGNTSPSSDRDRDPKGQPTHR